MTKAQRANMIDSWLAAHHRRADSLDREVHLANRETVARRRHARHVAMGNGRRSHLDVAALNAELRRELAARPPRPREPEPPKLVARVIPDDDARLSVFKPDLTPEQVEDIRAEARELADAALIERPAWVRPAPLLELQGVGEVERLICGCKARAETWGPPAGKGWSSAGDNVLVRCGRCGASWRAIEEA